MEKRRYIRRMLRMAALAVGMLVGGASAWGQRQIIPTYPDNDENSTRMGRSTEVIYANEGDVTIRFQDSNIAETIDGYIRWYVDDGNTESVSNLTNLIYNYLTICK